MCLPVLRVDVDRPPEVRNRFVKLSLGTDKQCQIEMRVGVFGVDLNRLLEFADGFVMLSRRAHHVPQVEVHTVVAGLDLCRFAAVTKSVREISLQQQRAGKIAMRFGVVRPQTQRLH